MHEKARQVMRKIRFRSRIRCRISVILAGAGLDPDSNFLGSRVISRSFVLVPYYVLRRLLCGKFLYKTPTQSRYFSADVLPVTFWGRTDSDKKLGSERIRTEQFQILVIMGLARRLVPTWPPVHLRSRLVHPQSR